MNAQHLARALTVLEKVKSLTTTKPISPEEMGRLKAEATICAIYIGLALERLDVPIEVPAVTS